MLPWRRSGGSNCSGGRRIRPAPPAGARDCPSGTAQPALLRPEHLDTQFGHMAEMTIMGREEIEPTFECCCGNQCTAICMECDRANCSARKQARAEMASSTCTTRAARKLKACRSVCNSPLSRPPARVPCRERQKRGNRSSHPSDRRPAHCRAGSRSAHRCRRASRQCPWLPHPPYLLIHRLVPIAP